MADLLRIGILILAGFVIFNILKQSNLFEMGGAKEETVEMPSAAKNELLEKVEANVNLGQEAPQYDAEAGVRPHQEDKSQLYDYNYQVLPYPQIATSPTDSYFMAGGVLLG